MVDAINRLLPDRSAAEERIAAMTPAKFFADAKPRAERAACADDLRRAAELLEFEEHRGA